MARIDLHPTTGTAVAPFGEFLNDGFDDISEHDVKIEETIEMSLPGSRLNTHNDLIKEEIGDKQIEMMGS